MAQPTVGSNRRTVLAGAGLAAFAAAAPVPAAAHEAATLAPEGAGDMSARFLAALQDASARDTVLHLDAGTFTVAGIDLPQRVRLSGVPGGTRIVFAGGSYFLRGADCEIVMLEGISFDGLGLAYEGADSGTGLLSLARVASLAIDRCTVLGSRGNGISLEACAGRVERCEIAGAAEAGLYAINSAGLTIAGNVVTDCGNGGILVHRWEIGEDKTMVFGNRVSRIRADAGGTGQNGNGINIFRADAVSVQDNIVADCAFSAIRTNSASNVRILGNACLRSGETGLYCEFGFEGAVIANNIVDGAAHGLSVVNFNEGGRLATVSGNIVRNLKTDGPYPPDAPGFGNGIAVEADAAVTGNVVEGAPRAGILVGWGPFMRNVVASGNVVRDSANGVLVSVVEGTGSAVIANNVFDSIGSGAVVGNRWVDIVTGDLTREGAERFPNLTVAGNSVS